MARGRSLVMLLGPGQGNDAPMFAPPLQGLHMPRAPGGPADQVAHRKRRDSRGGRPVGYELAGIITWDSGVTVVLSSHFVAFSASGRVRDRSAGSCTGAAIPRGDAV